jgi:uncharacterized alpha-E superfamily protein
LNNALLARYAECIFWLARYVERAENLARILDVNETFSRDSRGSQNWLSIIQLNADEKNFFKKHETASAASVLRFYITDAENPTSITSAIKSARENARSLRPLISTEMWVQLNVFHNRLQSIHPDELDSGNLTRLLAEIKQSCQTHTGITEGTLYRDQASYFYQMGRYIERADQTTRLLDIKYHLLLPKPSDVGSPVDVSQWNALLRSAAGYHAFRRMHSSQLTPVGVVEFLLLNGSFPRSVSLCVQEVSMTLNDVKARYYLRAGSGAAESLDELRNFLRAVKVGEILRHGLHEFLDLVQRHLNDVTSLLATDFFGHAPPTQSQSQSQS